MKNLLSALLVSIGILSVPSAYPCIEDELNAEDITVVAYWRAYAFHRDVEAANDLPIPTRYMRSYAPAFEKRHHEFYMIELANPERMLLIAFDLEKQRASHALVFSLNQFASARSPKPIICKDPQQVFNKMQICGLARSEKYIKCSCQKSVVAVYASHNNQSHAPQEILKNFTDKYLALLNKCPRKETKRDRERQDSALQLLLAGEMARTLASLPGIALKAFFSRYL